ncbi:MAG: menaquinone biosynthesis protein [Candidatus Sumerlaeia bacterium]|nr:menaquinone biosynthesis protein [Candidatus Sumerlaeia bacterium]
MRPLTLGIVPYLNVLPLLEGLEEDYPTSNWVRATPRELAGLLSAGEVQVALISTYEGLGHADEYTMIPGAGIGCDGPVRSVALCSRVPLQKIRRVQLDRASLSSIHLFRILAAELLNISPECDLSPAPLGSADTEDFDPEYDACVVIGDTALRWEHQYRYRLDLGEGWKQLTGLPFVFAGWWARRDTSISREEAEAFSRARALGQRAVSDIVSRLDPEVIMDHGGRDSLLDYLGNSIRFEVGDRERESINLYREKLLRHGLLATDSAPLEWAY